MHGVLHRLPGGEGLTLSCLRRSYTTRLESKGCKAVPAETPRSVLFRNRAKKFQSLASDVHETRPGYLELAAAYEQLANETERGEAIRAAASKETPK